MNWNTKDFLAFLVVEWFSNDLVVEWLGSRTYRSVTVSGLANGEEYGLESCAEKCPEVSQGKPRVDGGGIISTSVD